MKSVFKKGFMYRLSCRASAVLYVAENKTLAGKEDRTYEREAMGRKLAIVFFEDCDGDLVRRVDRSSGGMQQQLLTPAELLQTLGGIEIPPDPERTATTNELLLEIQFQDIEILRSVCTLEPATPDVQMYALEKEADAEATVALE